MADCIFCKIVSKEIPSEIVKETENLVVFKDINPKAPVHLLIIPKKHIADVREVSNEIWIEVKEEALELAKENRLEGFRLTTNAGTAAAVGHMHVHFLGKVSVEREV